MITQTQQTNASILNEYLSNGNTYIKKVYYGYAKKESLKLFKIFVQEQLNKIFINQLNIIRKENFLKC